MFASFYWRDCDDSEAKKERIGALEIEERKDLFVRMQSHFCIQCYAGSMPIVPRIGKQ